MSASACTRSVSGLVSFVSLRYFFSLTGLNAGGLRVQLSKMANSADRRPSSHTRLNTNYATPIDFNQRHELLLLIIPQKHLQHDTLTPCADYQIVCVGFADRCLLLSLPYPSLSFSRPPSPHFPLFCPLFPFLPRDAILLISLSPLSSASQPWRKKVKSTIPHEQCWCGAHLPYLGREPMGG